MPLIQINAPGAEPVTVNDIKAAARIDDAYFDAALTAMLIPAIRRMAEHRLGRRLITQTVELVLDGFPPEHIDLRLPNAQAIVSLKYLDTSGVEQSLAGAVYQLDSDSQPSRVLLKASQSWPATQSVPNAVRIRYTVGYGPAATDVPGGIRLWITAHVVQALDNPAGLNTGNLPSLPYVDRLLDAEAIPQVA